MALQNHSGGLRLLLVVLILFLQNGHGLPGRTLHLRRKALRQAGEGDIAAVHLGQQLLPGLFHAPEGQGHGLLLLHDLVQGHQVVSVGGGDFFLRQGGELVHALPQGAKQGEISLIYVFHGSGLR